MEPDTDTSLFELWKRFVVSNPQLKVWKSPKRWPREKQIELESIQARWGALLERKRTGELTDMTRVDAVSKAIESVSKFYGVEFEINAVEGSRFIDRPREPRGQTEFAFSWTWRVNMVLKEKASDLEVKRFDKLADVIDEELKQLPSAPVRLGPTWAVYEDSDGPRPEGYFENHPERRRLTSWMVYTQVWSGPPTLGPKHRWDEGA